MILTKVPHIVWRDPVPTLGIRLQTPMRGMHPLADRLRKELDRWFKVHGIEAVGNSFLRFHVIDMEGTMDIEVGLPVSHPIAGDGRVRAGELPAGRYACIAFRGHGLVGNKMLIETMRDRGWAADRWDTPEGDAFACRCETVLTDRRQVPLKKGWEIEVSIRLKEDNHG